MWQSEKISNIIMALLKKIIKETEMVLCKYLKENII